VRILTTGLVFVLLAQPLAARAGQVIIGSSASASTSGTSSNHGGVQVIVGGADPTPRPVRKRRTQTKRAAADGPLSRVAAASATQYVAGGTGLGGTVLRYAMRYVGVPYVWGGASPRGFDCSGFTQYVYSLVGVRIPRTADVQFAAGRQIAGNPAPGDLVFFQTYDYGASHVGIYMGGGLFVNSIGDDVHVTSFASEYFRSRYLGARRFLPDY